MDSISNVRSLLVFFVALFSTSVTAAPFVVADVISGVASCGVVLDGGPKVVVPAASMQCKFDVSSVSPGNHTVTMTAQTVNDPIWGTQESSPSAPFVFTKPAAPGIPTNLRLSGS